MDIYYKKYKNNIQNLYVRSQLFEEKLSPHKYFCGQPYMFLSVWLDNDKASARFGIGDLDDYDYEKGFLDNPSYELLHEIINRMKDHEYAFIDGFEDVEKFINVL